MLLLLMGITKCFFFIQIFNFLGWVIYQPPPSRSKLQMFNKTSSFAKAMGCCNCFGFIRRPRRQRATKPGIPNNLSQELLLDDDIEDEDHSYNDSVTNTTSGDDSEVQTRPKRSEDILNFKAENDMICRQFPVKETHKVVRTEVIVLWALYFFLNML